MNQLARTPEERDAVFKQIDKLNKILEEQKAEVARVEEELDDLECEVADTEYEISQLMQQFPEIYYSK